MSEIRVTEFGDNRITEAGEVRVIEMLASNLFFSGDGPPVIDGNGSDHYFDRASGDLFVRQSGAWVRLGAFWFQAE